MHRVYLQGSWLKNEKIADSCLPADIKAVSLFRALLALIRRFRAGARTMEEGKLFLSVIVLYCHDYLNFLVEKKLLQVK